MANLSSWWWGSSSSAGSAEFDRVLENCTSSNLPSSSPPPITDSLTLSDLIRSSAVTSTYAVKSLRKRLLNSNPNVQLLTISVIDICIKNGGDTFLKEIGTTKEFIEDCSQLITNSITNREVKQKLLTDYQNWSIAFESVPFLSGSELVFNYRRLKSIGIEFPAKDPSATSAMVDSMSAPEWRDNEVCERCRTAFSFTNRKHHCRNCGGVFDGQCSSKRRTLTHFGLTELVRICDGCDRALSNNSNSKLNIRRNSVSVDNPSSNKLSITNAHHRSATVHSSTGLTSHRYTTTTNEEADLEKAIALSLKDLTQPIIISKSAPPEHSLLTQSPSKPRTDEENDPALAAAIAASLKEAENTNLPSAPPPIDSTRYRPLAPPKPPLPSYDLTTEQTNAIYNFSSEVETAIKTGSLNPTNSTLSNAHSTVETIRPLVIRGLENADRKTQLLREMNDKLSEVVKTYDRLLSEQIMYRTQQSQQTTSSTPSVYATSSSSVYNSAVVQPSPNLHPQSSYVQSSQPVTEAHLSSYGYNQTEAPRHQTTSPLLASVYNRPQASLEFTPQSTYQHHHQPRDLTYNHSPYQQQQQQQPQPQHEQQHQQPPPVPVFSHPSPVVVDQSSINHQPTLAFNPDLNQTQQSMQAQSSLLPNNPTLVQPQPMTNWNAPPSQDLRATILPLTESDPNQLFVDHNLFSHSSPGPQSSHHSSVPESSTVNYSFPSVPNHELRWINIHEQNRQEEAAPLIEL